MPHEVEEPQIDEREYLKMTEQLRWELSDLLNVKCPLEGFKKKHYEGSFAEYIKEHEDIFRRLEDVYVYSPKKQEILHNLAEDFVKSAQLKLEKEPKKRKRQAQLSDNNMILVVYVFPALLRQKGQAGSLFAKEIQKAWKDAFPRTQLNPVSYEEIVAGFQKSYCYITTAVCQSLNKGDDCEELTLLRNYRDEYLLKQKQGEELVQEYYDIAPTIVKHINRQEDVAEIYRNIYENYLVKCICLIQQNKKEQCREIYAGMVYDLKEKYFS